MLPYPAPPSQQPAWLPAPTWPAVIPGWPGPAIPFGTEAAYYPWPTPRPSWPWSPPAGGEDTPHQPVPSPLPLAEETDPIETEVPPIPPAVKTEVEFDLGPGPADRWSETPAQLLPEAVGIPQVGPLRGGLTLSELLSKRIRGFSDRQLTEHHRIYREYFSKFREVRTKLRTAERGEASEVFSRYRALKTSEGIAWNGIRMHELYFDQLSGAGRPAGGRISEWIGRDFGSFDNWVKDFVACAKSARTWALVVYDYYDRRLHNLIADSNESGPLVLSVPLIVCDMAEHAYAIDFGSDKDAYLKAFLMNLDWESVNSRLGEVLKMEFRM